MKRLFMLVMMTCAISTLFSQNITSAEYFFDHDPGPGNGIPVSIGTPGAVVNFSATIPENLSPGFHRLGIRTRDANGNWGFFETRNFYLTAATSDMKIITAAEYFFDHDPGPGKASALTINSPGNIISQSFSIPIPTDTSAGKHLLAIRVKDQVGNWGLFEKDSLTVEVPSGSITCPGNITVDPFTDNCKAVVNHIDAVGLPANDSSYTYTLTGATSGSGIGTASGQLFSAGVTTVTYALVNSPTVNCSFTVTVKPSVTPTATISIPRTTVCEGALTSFYCNFTGYGSNPSWQWRKNGIPVGTMNNLYRDSNLKNGDTITVTMTSSVTCANPQTVISAPVIMTVQETVTPSVRVEASASTICNDESVTFTAIPTHGGSPIYNWVKNGLVVADDSIYQTSALANGDSVYVIMYNTTDCVTISPVQSNVIYITTSQAVMPSANITASTTSICSGTLVGFTISQTGGGDNPTYQWQLNGNNIPGATGSTYQSSSLVNGDKIKLVMISSLACASPSSVTSNEITIAVNASAPASVAITASQTTICSGQQVIFTATPTNGGTSPVYEWTVNNNAMNTISSNVYQSTTLHDGDVVRVTMSPSQGCGNNTPVYSNSITMHVNSSATPSVTITASSIDLCSGQQVTFTANPTNGGSSPSYQWKLNGVNVGGDSAVFHTSTLANADTVKVVMTSSLGCANPQTVTSNRISMDISASIIPSVFITASATAICSGTPVTFTATPTNGGNPTYEWKLNGNHVGTNSNTYQNSALSNGDSILVYMTSSLPCSNPKISKSNVVVIVVNNAQVFYRDIDGDGYGNASSGTIQSCDASTGYVSDSTDCNDSNASVNPGTTEICGNAIDDNCNGEIDENCSLSLPVLTLRTYPVKEGDLGEKTLDVQVALDKPTSVPAAVHYSTIQEDATSNVDFVGTSGWLYFPVGSTTATFHVRIKGDILREGNERFRINFSNPSNIMLGNTTWSEAIIIDDDKGKFTTAGGNRRLLPFEQLDIPNLVRRNTIWNIPEIGEYENGVVIMNAQGQVVRQLVNYRNQTPLGNLSIGLYFYRIQLRQPDGNLKIYSGRLMVTE